MAAPNPATAAIVMDGEETGTGGTIFLASTPLHSFFALGLMAGPLGDGPRRLWLIDQPAGARDFVGEALDAMPSMNVQVRRFAALRGTRSARSELRRISALVAAAAPVTIAVGMDHRLEFHAAVRGWPQARRAYIDDGLYSYLPHQNAMPAWQEHLSNWRRSLKYGLRAERPSLVGGSRAVQSAWVLLPACVHAGLAGKPVEGYRAEWFATDDVQRVCVAAAALAGLDAAVCAQWTLLLLLPHPRFLAADADLRHQLQALARREIEAGGRVALKSHPNATAPAHEQLGLPANAADTVPPRLPAEVLAPLLRQTRVIGSLTTALLSLSMLGQGLRVYRLPVPVGTSGFEAGARRVYDAAGVKVFDPAQAG